MSVQDQAAVRFAPFRLSGDLNSANAAAYRLALYTYAATTEGAVICDCTNLESLDSSGITMLLRLREELDEHGRRLRMVNVVGALQPALDVTGLVDHFGVS